MQLPELIPGKLVKRYKRFLADIVLDNGAEITAHVANSGSMLGLSTPGSRVWVCRKKPGGKLDFGWELVEIEIAGAPALVGVNTSHPNRIAEEAIAAGRIPELGGYASIRREVNYPRVPKETGDSNLAFSTQSKGKGESNRPAARRTKGVSENSRVDLFLEGHPTNPPAFVEIKNVHLWRQEDMAEFPDAVTARGAKHLKDLAREVAAGARGVMLYVVQGPASGFRLATDIDPTYAKAFTEATAVGVEAYAYTCAVTREGITLAQRVPIIAP